MRGKLAVVAAAAATARVEARAATDAEAQLAAVDEDEARELAALRAEVYVGFHEAAELPAPVAPEPPADDRARSDGCTSIDEPATRALVLRALERNLDLEQEARFLRDALESRRHYYEGIVDKNRCEKWSLLDELNEKEKANVELKHEVFSLEKELEEEKLWNGGVSAEVREFDEKKELWETERERWETERERWEAERAGSSL